MNDWEIHGLMFSNCSCAYGCPCQFNALPTDALPVCQSGGYWAGVFLKITVDRPYLAYVSTVRPETLPEILPFEIFAARFER